MTSCEKALQTLNIKLADSYPEFRAASLSSDGRGVSVMVEHTSEKTEPVLKKMWVRIGEMLLLETATLIDTSASPETISFNIEFVKVKAFSQ